VTGGAGRPPPGKLRGLHLHFEPTSGIAGDMAVAALVDAGVPGKVVSDAIAAVGVRGLRVTFSRRKTGAFVGRAFDVDWPGRDDAQQGHAHEHEHEHEHGSNGHGAHPHRSYREIKRLLARAKLEREVRALAGEMFMRIAEVEAEIHGVRVADVEFHEVGAFDSIADIVGVAAAIAYLAPVSIGSLPPVVGTGFVRTAHGRLPVPAPATAALLAGVPLLPEGQGELTTPTGAAILVSVVDMFGPLPPMRLAAVGYGAGTRVLPDRPNVLRVAIGAPLGVPDEMPATHVVLLQTNIDDMSPELVGPLYEALAAAGAVDVWSTPILMKKGRPALEVSALATQESRVAVERAFFESSTTLGVRRRALERVVLARSFAPVETPYGRVRVKLAALDGEVLGAQPELEDCRRLAARAHVPVREVMSAAAAAARPFMVKAPARRRRP
jgi:pyridinium-3,5-bisthiocarboxylic acid mononucleotide nickel chelatase